jgi:uncharacterized protein YjbI with pentapeptide repeats
MLGRRANSSAHHWTVYSFCLSFLVSGADRTFDVAKRAAKPVAVDPVAAARGEFLKQGRDPAIAKKALEDATAVSRALWLSFLTFGTYLVITFAGVTHRDLLLEEPIILPVLNAKLPLVTFFWVAPILFVIFHLYLLLSLKLLADQVHSYVGHMEELGLDMDEQDRARLQLPNFVVVQVLGGTSGQINSWAGRLMRFTAFLTLVAGPIILLLFAQLMFLPYHGWGVTMAQRVMVVLDLVMIWYFWAAIKRWDGPRSNKTAYAAASFAVILLTFFGFMYPGEWFYGALPKAMFLETGYNNPAQGLNFFFNTIVYSGEPLFDEKVFSEAEKRDEQRGTAPWQGARSIKVLRGRDFTYANISHVNLRKANLSFAVFDHVLADSSSFEGANLDYASFDNSLLGKSYFDDASLIYSNFFNAQLFGASFRRARMHGALLNEADLPGANLDDADFSTSIIDASMAEATDPEDPLATIYVEEASMQSINLNYASLRGANLGQVNLSKASMYGVKLNGASLDSAILSGVSFEDVEMPGASLQGAQMQGTTFLRTDLSGSTLDAGRLQGASFRFSKLEAASLTGARLYGANLESANLENAYLESAKLSGAVLSETRFKDSFFANTEVGRNSGNPIGLETAFFESTNPYYSNLESQQPDALKLQKDAFDNLVKEALEDIPASLVPDVTYSLSSLDPEKPEPKSTVDWRTYQNQSDVSTRYIDKLVAKLILISCRDTNAPYVAKGIGAAWIKKFDSRKVLPLVNELLRPCPGAKGLDEITIQSLKEFQKKNERNLGEVNQ